MSASSITSAKISLFFHCRYSLIAGTILAQQGSVIKLPKAPIVDSVNEVMMASDVPTRRLIHGP